MRRLAVLLRAVNVGGTGKLAMGDLKAALTEWGHAAPQTLGAAGSAVLGSAVPPDELEADLEARIRDRFGLATDVFARDHAQLAAARNANPFGRMAQDLPSGLLVLFMKGEADPAAVEALRGKIQGPEEIAPGPACLYVAYGAGMGSSKLTGSVIERAVGLRGTGRNWNTLGKLLELTRA